MQTTEALSDFKVSWDKRQLVPKEGTLGAQ